MPRRNVLAGVILIGAGILVWGGSVAGMFLLRLGGWTQIAIVPALLLGGAAIVRGRRHLARGGESVLARDPRPPILYLRQFTDDGALQFFSSFSSHRRLTFRHWVTPTQEERLSRALGALGPMVAIGRPGEALPELGAARIYAASWQDAVHRLVDRAQLVMLQIGETAGVRWETEQLVARIDPRKLILCLPMDNKTGERPLLKRYEGFVRETAACFPVPLPSHPGDAQFIYFGRDWAPHLFVPSMANRTIGITEQNDRPVLGRALTALNEEFLRVATPYFVRVAGFLIALLLIYFPFGWIALNRTGEVIQATTLFGLLASQREVVVELTPRFDNLRAFLNDVATQMSAPAGVEPRSLTLDPKPLFGRRLHRANTDIITVEALEQIDSDRPLSDLLLGNLEIVLRWVYRPPTFEEDHDRRAGNFRARLEEALALRYVVLVRKAAQEPFVPATGGMTRALLRLDIAIADVAQRAMIGRYTLDVVVTDLPALAPGEPLSAWQRAASRRLMWAARPELIRSLAQWTGGTLIAD